MDFSELVKKSLDAINEKRMSGNGPLKENLSPTILSEVESLEQQLKSENYQNFLRADPKIITFILKNRKNDEWKDKWFLHGPLPYLLVHDNSEVCVEAANFAWALDDASITAILNVLGSKGMIPSGIPRAKALQALQILRGSCPNKRVSFFEKEVLEKFGPGSLNTNSALPNEGTVHFKEKFKKPGRFGGEICTYEIYTANTKNGALHFLTKKTITEKNYFIEVETPEGDVGIDYFGIYGNE